jgi:uncharacterized membrane protein
MIALDIASHVSSVIEVYITLRMLGFTASAGAAYIIESLTKVINFAFGFVPGTIGVYETGNGIILRTLGYTTAIGLALAIVRKAAIIFWTVIGVFVLTWRAVPNAWASLLHRSPRLRKLMDSLVLSNIAHRPARTAVSIAGIAWAFCSWYLLLAWRTACCANVAGVKPTSALRSFCVPRAPSA